jgi:hypothetical protein
MYPVPNDPNTREITSARSCSVNHGITIREFYQIATRCGCTVSGFGGLTMEIYLTILSEPGSFQKEMKDCLRSVDLAFLPPTEWNAQQCFEVLYDSRMDPPQ